MHDERFGPLDSYIGDFGMAASGAAYFVYNDSERTLHHLYKLHVCATPQRLCK